MENMYWELQVLSRCVAYNNLSGAAVHVGLSQPQLSRIISKLEQELEIILLDRGARRKSGWTPVAMRLAEVFSRSRKQLESEIHSLTQETEPRHLRVASLEGLAVIAAEYCQFFYSFPKMKVVELDIHDTSQLEEEFMKGNYDLIFTSREPGRKKYRFELELGRQSMDEISTSKDTRVLSFFQFHSQEHKIDYDSVAKIFTSNSLEVRRHWVNTYGGIGSFPSQIRKTRTKSDSERVLLIGGTQLSPKTWQRIEEYQIQKQ